MRHPARISLLFVFILCGATAFAQSHSATMTWTAAQQPAGVTVASWNVLRGTASGGPYQQIANVPGSTTSYTDSAISSGQNYFYVIQAVDTVGYVSANSMEAEAIIPNSPPPLAVSTTSLPPATTGTTYSATIAATGGTGSYTWSGTGVDGLTFTGTGLLSGTPTQAGTFTQSVTVRDSTGATASASLTLSVTAALAVSTTSLPPATTGTTYSATIAATGGTAPYTWSGTGIDGLIFTGTGLLSGTPTQAGTFTQSVTVRDSTGATAGASLTLSVTATLAVSTTSLPPATTGTAYSATIAASGGTAPYTWSGTGIDGLTFSAGGVLSGTPTQSGTFAQSVTVKDSTGATAGASLTLSVTATLAVSTTSLPPATTGTTYSATIAASGGTAPYTWSGTGIDGLTFSAAGVLSGTPTQSGSFTQNVTLKDSTGATAGASLTLSVTATLVVSTTSLPPATAGASYSAMIAASGGTAPYTWSGTGVDGLAFSTGGVLSGIPSQAGTFTQSVTVKDSTGATASASLTLSVTATLAVSTTSLPPATAGASYSATIAASGGTAPYTWSGTGVDGLTFSAAGVLSGTPTQAGTFTQSVTVRDSTGATASAALTLSVAAPMAPLVVSTTSLPPATAGAGYSATITASGGTAPYTWSGAGVDGLTFSTGGVLSGTPSQAGTFPQSVTVTDSIGAAASASLTWTVASSSVGATSIALVQHASADAGVTVSSALTFPPGNTVGNWIAVSIRAGAANETFRVGDSNGNTYRKAIQFSMSVDPDTLAIFYAENIAGGANTVTVSDTSSATLRFAILEYSGVATSGSFDAAAVTEGISASLNSGSVATSVNGELLLGAMMTADPERYTAGSGYRIEESVPAEPGTKLIMEDQVQAVAGPAAATATLAATDEWAAGIAAFKPAGSGGGTAPAITSASSATFTAGAAGSFTVTTTGTPTPSLTESGALPVGVMFTDNGDGSATLSGAPSSGSGTYSITITAINGVGTPPSQPFTLTVGSGLAVSTLNLPPATAGTSYSATITAIGGSAPYTWSGTGVDGLMLGVTGVLSGTPTQAGTFAQNVTVNDAAGNTASASLTLSVGGAQPQSSAPVAPVLALDVRLAANRLSWTPQTQPSGVTIARWRIFRSTDGISYALLGHVAVGTTVYRDTNVSSGQTYYYVAEAVSTTGAASPYSNEVAGTRP